MGRQLGVRKGAWTQEEDLVLRKFIEKYGEGKWNLVPQRAGLNRCRKSCRLRWLNYLTPNIKRGEFDDGEIDLIIRLHKLLGNRWSLIAGRLPGRTANHIKNYWNSHLSKKVTSHDKQETAKASYAKVLKPQPWRLSKSLINYGNLEASGRKEEGTEPLLAPDNDAIWWKGLFQNERDQNGPLGSADAMRELLVLPAIDNGDAEGIRDENSTFAEDSQEGDDLILDPSLWVQLEGNCFVDT